MNEPGSDAVRKLVREREGSLIEDLFQEACANFLKHIEIGAWSILPVDNRVLQRVSRMLTLAPVPLYLRSGDAIHLATAVEAGELEVWASDRHMLAAASHFGLNGRSA